MKQEVGDQIWSYPFRVFDGIISVELESSFGKSFLHSLLLFRITLKIYVYNIVYHNVAIPNILAYLTDMSCNI